MPHYSRNRYGYDNRTGKWVPSKRRWTFNLLPILGAVTFVLIVVGSIIFWVAKSTGNETVQTCTVEDKDRTRDADGKSDMRIYTQECGVLRVGDVLLKGQFNAADIYSSIDVGQAYEFTTVGYRIPIMSEFPTIIEVK